MKNIKVVIPLKTNSERVLNKNLRPFYKEESLFDIKAKQLLKIFNPTDWMLLTILLSLQRELPTIY